MFIKVFYSYNYKVVKMKKKSMYTIVIVIIILIIIGASIVLLSSTSSDYTLFAVRGTLSSSDAAQNKAQHNQIVGSFQTNAQALGDTSHTALLDTANAQNFLALDTWTNLSNAQKFFSDPQAQQAFGSLFSGQPDISVWSPAKGWTSWGSFNDVRGKGNIFIVTVRGKLKPNTTQAQAVHDQIANGGKQQSMSLGDTTHLAFINVQDQGEFMAMDVWTNQTNMQQFFSNPQIQQAFGQLFDGQPALTIWHPTDWASY